MMEAVRRGGDRQELHERLRVHARASADARAATGAPADLLDRLAGDAAFGLTRGELAARGRREAPRRPFRRAGRDLRPRRARPGAPGRARPRRAPPFACEVGRPVRRRGARRLRRRLRGGVRVPEASCPAARPVPPASRAGPASETGGAWSDEGMASWYGGDDGFEGKPTASGEMYDSSQLTAAHRELPLGSVVEVTSLDNGRVVRVRINDRGPFVKGRIIDLSRAAAQAIAMIGPGTARVRLVLVAPGIAPTPVSRRRPLGRPGRVLRRASPRRPARRPGARRGLQRLLRALPGAHARQGRTAVDAGRRAGHARAPRAGGLRRDRRPGEQVARSAFSPPVDRGPRAGRRPAPS